ncbi:hypothetical protein BCR35DRAFT_350631 [Leucosporidium creatinivorum]|uniref:F-box domain-containing protein n=1 Tax=Leucosporidium creatinivorum TaxID=106004 RepID=A0A1Y2FYM1_9BASI|nr:hypothetical protein BCR35DRAFT_350631 [Leucosporidium creatinivorum]
MPSLPTEIIAQIIQEVANERDDRGRVVQVYYSTLRRLCLVSKAWLPPARSALYETVLLEYTDERDDSNASSDDHWDDLDDLDAPYPPPKSPPFRGQDLLRSLRRNPQLGALVRALTVTFEFWVDDVLKHTAEKTVASLIKRCPGIIRLRLKSAGGLGATALDDLAHWLVLRTPSRAMLRQVEDLEMVWGDEGCPALLAAAPQIRKLAFDYDRGSFSIFRSLPFRLTHLKLHGTPPDKDLVQLLKYSSATLRILDVDHRTLLGISAPLPLLSSLKLDIRGWAIEREIVDQIIAAIAHFPSLQFLHLRHLSVPVGGVVPFLLSLPITLLVLNISDCDDVDTEVVLQYLKELSPRHGFALVVEHEMKSGREIQEACSRAGVSLL